MSLLSAQSRAAKSTKEETRGFVVGPVVAMPSPDRPSGCRYVLSDEAEVLPSLIFWICGDRKILPLPIRQLSQIAHELASALGVHAFISTTHMRCAIPSFGLTPAVQAQATTNAQHARKRLRQILVGQMRSWGPNDTDGNRFCPTSPGLNGGPRPEPKSARSCDVQNLGTKLSAEMPFK
ncbi:hypothetical protein BKA66DRAFT_444654 [Pyrenochaeta sp. MPI-SDFR-AT-0127]|nr:hypothetical protein BKA66DRAFT_444654 [Pyrenochaeta sp. MPI-SDFR-AT-0127]